MCWSSTDALAGSARRPQCEVLGGVSHDRWVDSQHAYTSVKCQANALVFVPPLATGVMMEDDLARFFPWKSLCFREPLFRFNHRAIDLYISLPAALQDFDIHLQQLRAILSTNSMREYVCDRYTNNTDAEISPPKWKYHRSWPINVAYDCYGWW